MAHIPNKSIPHNEVRTRNKIEQHEHCRKADARRVKVVDEEGNPINDSNPLAVNATFSGAADAKLPFIVQITMAAADTEYEYQFPLNTDQYIMKPLKNKATIKYAFIVGNSATLFDKIRPGNTLERGDLKLNATTKIYFQSNIPNNTMLFQVWTL